MKKLLKLTPVPLWPIKCSQSGYKQPSDLLVSIKQRDYSQVSLVTHEMFHY